jgi:hypothetical protein
MCCHWASQTVVLEERGLPHCRFSTEGTRAPALLWSLPNDGFDMGGIAVGPNGVAYLAGVPNWSGPSVFAVDTTTGTLLWSKAKSTTGLVTGSPAISPNGTHCHAQGPRVPLTALEA